MRKQELTHAILIILAVWCLGMGVALAAPWPFEWIALTTDIVGLALMSVVLPLFVDKPRFRGTLFTGNFYPCRHTWPVWLFWLGLGALIFHAAAAVKVLVMNRQIDYHAVRVTVVAGWLFLVSSGRIPRWKSVDPPEIPLAKPSKRDFVTATFLVSIVFLPIGCWFVQTKQDLEKLLAPHFSAIATNGFETALADYAPQFFQKITQADWLKTLTNVTSQLGSYKNFEISGWNIRNQTTAAGTTTTVSLECQVTYSKHAATESFTLFKGLEMTITKLPSTKSTRPGYRRSDPLRWASERFLTARYVPRHRGRAKLPHPSVPNVIGSSTSSHVRVHSYGAGTAR